MYVSSEAICTKKLINSGKINFKQPKTSAILMLLVYLCSMIIKIKFRFSLLEEKKSKHFQTNHFFANFFLIFRLREAREIYTQSLQICPVNYEKPAENKDYAIILANR